MIPHPMPTETLPPATATLLPTFTETPRLTQLPHLEAAPTQEALPASGLIARNSQSWRITR